MLRDFSARLTDDFDVVDVHFMPGVIHDKKDEETFPGVPFYITRFPGGNVPVFRGQTLAAGPKNFDFAAFSKAWDSACHGITPQCSNGPGILTKQR